LIQLLRIRQWITSIRHLMLTSSWQIFR